MEIDSDAIDYGDESLCEEKDLETLVPPRDVDGGEDHHSSCDSK